MTNNPTIDGVSLPINCRQRMAAEGKPYPRSSCEVCGQFSPKWRECDALLSAPAVERQEPEHPPHPYGYIQNPMREDFEQWAAEESEVRGVGETIGLSTDEHHDRYSMIWTQTSWMAWQGCSAALQSTIAQLQARIGELESLHGEVYQVLGALDASAVVLDKVSAAANGESIPNTALLPYFSKGIQLPDKRQAMRSGDYICGWNAAIDATAALNTPKPAEWHDVSGDDEGLVS